MSPSFPIVLLRLAGRPVIGRLLAELPAGLQVEVARLDGDPGPTVLRLARRDVVAVLGLTCADLAEAQAQGRQAQVAFDDDLDAAWPLIKERFLHLSSLTELLAGPASARVEVAARDRVALAIFLTDDPFQLRAGPVLRRTASERDQTRTERARDQAVMAESLLLRAAIDSARERPQAGLDADVVARLEQVAVASNAVDAALQRALLPAAAASDGASADPLLAGCAQATLRATGEWDELDDPEAMRLSRARRWREDGLAALRDQPDVPASVVSSAIPWVTIDGPGAHEVDDAVWAEQRGTDVVLHIAIASPSCWFAAGDALDREALERGAAFYHPRHTEPMLPPSLSQESGSLSVGASRPALVFRVVLDSDGRPTSSSVEEAWIRVSAAWTYEQVDVALATGSACGPVQPALADLLALAASRSESWRIRQGAWLLYPPAVDVFAPRHGEIVVRESSQASPARRLVTEAMILAGLAAGRFLRLQRVAAPYRVQDSAGEAPLPPGLYTDPYDAHQVLCTLRPAHASVDGGRHASMAVDDYLQVTSPLRRYVDLLSHRQILAALRGQPAPYDAPALMDAVARSGYGVRQGRLIQRRAALSFKLAWLARRGPNHRLQAQVLEERTRTAPAQVILPSLALRADLDDASVVAGQWLQLEAADVDLGARRLVLRQVGD